MNTEKLTAVETIEKEIFDRITRRHPNDIIIIQGQKETLVELFQEMKVMEKEQRGYSEEQVREMLFMALYEPQEECCTTHTKDSIVRKVLKTFEQLRLVEKLENEIDNL